MRGVCEVPSWIVELVKAVVGIRDFELLWVVFGQKLLSNVAIDSDVQGNECKEEEGD